jgi:LytS/YehU family sensor histidine kinase
MGRLQYGVAAEPGLERASIPPLMLISLVENAVRHGAEPKTGPVRIDVRARRRDVDGIAMLEVAVADDGAGFGNATAGGGLGLANIQQRLRDLFGGQASLQLKAGTDGGVTATLLLPLAFEP